MLVDWTREGWRVLRFEGDPEPRIIKGNLEIVGPARLVLTGSDGSHGYVECVAVEEEGSG